MSLILSWICHGNSAIDRVQNRKHTINSVTIDFAVSADIIFHSKHRSVQCLVCLYFINSCFLLKSCIKTYAWIGGIHILPIQIKLCNNSPYLSSTANRKLMEPQTKALKSGFKFCETIHTPITSRRNRKRPCETASGIILRCISVRINWNT